MKQYCYHVYTSRNPYEYDKLERVFSSPLHLVGLTGESGMMERIALFKKELSKKNIFQLLITMESIDMDTGVLEHTVLESFRMPLKVRIEINKIAKGLSTVEIPDIHAQLDNNFDTVHEDEEV